MISVSSVLKPRDDLRYRIIDGEAVVVRQEAAELIVLNETGARILELLDGARSVAHIVDTMAQEFQVSRADLERDVLSFVQELAELGAAVEVAR